MTKIDKKLPVSPDSERQAVFFSLHSVISHRYFPTNQSLHRSNKLELIKSRKGNVFNKAYGIVMNVRQKKKEKKDDGSF